MVKTYSDEHGIMYVDYAEDKRILKLRVYYIDLNNAEDVRRECLDMVIAYVTANANDPEHLRNMTEVNFWRLVERLSILVCRYCSPTLKYGISKPEIRAAVSFVLKAGIECGYWPARYAITDRTFVQLDGGVCDEE